MHAPHVDITVLTHFQSDLVLITASPEFTSPSAQSFESSNGDQAEETRVVSFELRVMNNGDPEGMKLEKVGDWSFMGPVNGVVVCQDVNRAFPGHQL